MANFRTLMTCKSKGVDILFFFSRDERLCKLCGLKMWKIEKISFYIVQYTIHSEKKIFHVKFLSSQMFTN